MSELVLTPVTVLYCAKCGVPPEYCEYGPDFESLCVPWLRKKHPDWLAQHYPDVFSNKQKSSSSSKEEATSDTHHRPANPWTMQERLTAFYEEYQPDKVSDVPMLLEKYAGKEEKLFIALTKKYGPEPEDPYYDDSDDDDEDDDYDDEEENDNVTGDLQDLKISGDGKKRRGVKAKKAQSVETKVTIQTEKRKKRKATTIVMGMDTIPNIKLKDVSKAFSKKFAGSSSVKEDATGGKQIIIQGDHMEDVAQMVVAKFKVPATSVFLDFDGDIVPYK